ncbi:MAG: TonB-dependent receptor [Ferruginibacter sp.]
MRFFSTLLSVATTLLLCVLGDAECMGQSPGSNIYGKLIDAGNSKPIEGASIQLLYWTHGNESAARIIATQLTNRKGEFYMDDIPEEGNVILKLSCVGYKPFDLKLALKKSTISKDVGNIRLFADTSQLKEITVNNTRPLIEMQADKRVYNPEKDISIAGGSALDAIKNIPGISVDANGNIIVRGGSPLVLIDGRPTTLLPEQIPAEQIAAIELMTNPDAKYDAGSSGSGIINIVLKKNKKTGYNGNLRAGIDSRPRPYFGGDFNLKEGKVNFFAAAQLNFRKSMATTSTYRENYTNTATVVNDQEGSPWSNGYFGFGRFGIDYFASNRTTLSINSNFSKGNIKVNDLLLTQKDSIYLAGRSVAESVRRNIYADIDYKSLGGGISVKHNFSDDGKEWTADVHYNQNKNYNVSDYSSQVFDESGNAKPYYGAERALGGSKIRFYTFQTDFINPLSPGSKFETGLRIVGRNYNSYNDNFRENTVTGLYEILLPTVVEYDFRDIVYAAYGSYSHQAKPFSYQLGLRVESSSYRGTIVNKNERFKNDFPLSLFPSLFASQKLSEKQSIQFNYSRKINRPGFFHILPFIDFSDSLNLLTGNAALKPEFIHMAELSFQQQYGEANSFFATLYGRYNKDMLTRYQYKASNPDPAKPDSVVYTSYINADKSYTAGLELVGRNKITRWWDINSNFNLFHVSIESDNIPGLVKINRWSWLAKLNNSFTLPMDFTLQLNADYQARSILPAINTMSAAGVFGGGIYGSTQNTAQGYIRPIYGLDIALRKDFLKNKSASFTLFVSDVFRSRSYETVINTPFLSQDNYMLRDPQLMRLSFSWRFGKIDATLLKRKNNKAEQESFQRVQPGM